MKEMKFTHNGKGWLIKRAKSCFTARPGKDDVSVYKQSVWGRRGSDGNLYKCCLRLAAEDGSLLRDYEAVPNHITVEYLKQNGFIG